MKKKERAARDIEKFRGRARAIIKDHFGAVKRVNYLPGGLTNFVFECVVGDGEFVVRISPDPQHLNSFLKEQWAAAAAKTHGIPVAEILEVAVDPSGSPYMVTRKIDGRNAMNHEARHSILKELGALGARINSIRTKGFGDTFDWSENQLSQKATFKDWLLHEFDAFGRLEKLQRYRLLDTKRVAQLKKIFVNAQGKRARPVLNHGDLRLKNVVVDNSGKILALIDWEGCTSNIPPSWELSIALHDLCIDGKQHFLEGYGIKPKRLANSIPLIRAFNIANYASSIEDIAKDKSALAQYRLRLNGILDLYCI